MDSSKNIDPVWVALAIGCAMLGAALIIRMPSHATPNPNITPDSLTLILRNEGCEVWRFKDRGEFHYYANCSAGPERITQATSAQGGGDSELIPTKYKPK